MKKTKDLLLSFFFNGQMVKAFLKGELNFNSEKNSNTSTKYFKYFDETHRK